MFCQMWPLINVGHARVGLLFHANEKPAHNWMKHNFEKKMAGKKMEKVVLLLLVMMYVRFRLMCMDVLQTYRGRGRQAC